MPAKPRTRTIRTTKSTNRPPQITKRHLPSLSILFATAFLTILIISACTAKIPYWLPALYIITSLFTFLLYAKDKSAARKGTWRTPESTLHLLSLAGGWPGALIAQQKLRHKTQKQPFRFIFQFTVILNCLALALLCTPAGTTMLRSFLPGAS